MAVLADRVIVYGAESQIGLSIVRELGRAGCQVVAVGKSERSIGLRSKYVWKSYVIEDFAEDSIVDQLNQIERETGAQHLLCISETDILFFNRIKDRLVNLRPLVPDMERMSKVLDKSLTAELGHSVGLESPRTHQIHSLIELDEIAGSLHFPVILKWSNPLDVISEARAFGVSIEKIDYCHARDELKEKLAVFSSLGKFPMIQEYCPGYGLGHFFFRHQGEILLRFQHRRIHEWPPEGGVSTLCESVPLDQHRQLQAQSIQLLERLDWEGVAMVEYRYDPATDKAVLMEVNGRFWGSLPLAYQCGAPFALYTYQVLGLGKAMDKNPQPRAGLRSQNTIADIKRLYRILFQADKIKDKSLHFNKLKEIYEFFRMMVSADCKYYVFETRDMAPFFYDVRNILSRLFLPKN